MKRVSGWIRTHTIEVDDLTRHRHDRPEHGKYQCCAMPYGRRSHHSDRDRQASSPGCRSVKIRQRLSLDLTKGSRSYQQGLDVLLESLIVEALEGLLVVELAGVGVAGRVVLAEDVEPQLLGPPVSVLYVVSAHCPWVQVYVVPMQSYLLAATADVGQAHGALCRSFLFDTAHCECDAVVDV
jgi:hypothetical protein